MGMKGGASGYKVIAENPGERKRMMIGGIRFKNDG